MMTVTQLKSLNMFAKLLSIIKYIYFLWILLVFLFWFLWAFFVLGSQGYYEVAKVRSNPYMMQVLTIVHGFVEGNDSFASLMFISPICILITFLIITIIRRKISVWECCIIAAIWAMVIYVFPHLRS